MAVMELNFLSPAGAQHAVTREKAGHTSVPAAVVGQRLPSGMSLST